MQRTTAISSHPTSLHQGKPAKLPHRVVGWGVLLAAPLLAGSLGCAVDKKPIVIAPTEPLATPPAVQPADNAGAEDDLAPDAATP